MLYLGINVGRRHHEAALLDDAGAVVWRQRLSAGRAGFVALADRLSALDVGVLTVALEATAIYWLALHAWFTERGAGRVGATALTMGGGLDRLPVQVTSALEACSMGLKVSYTRARDHLAEVLDEVEDTREVAIISRRGHEDVALIPAAELASLRDTAYLLRSPANAARLFTALARARRGDTPPADLAALRRELGLDADG